MNNESTTLISPGGSAALQGLCLSMQNFFLVTNEVLAASDVTGTLLMSKYFLQIKSLPNHHAILFLLSLKVLLLLPPFSLFLDWVFR